MKYIALFISFFPSLVLACLPTDGRDVSLIGKIVPAAYKAEDRVVHYRALELDDAQCFLPDGEFSEEVVEIKNVQLIAPKGVELEVGNKYKILGAAFHWHTGHHYTKIVLNVAEAKKL